MRGENAGMSYSGSRDRIQDLQLSILQDYLEIVLRDKYGDGWIEQIITLSESKYNKKDDHWQTYKRVAEDKRDKGRVMVTKKTFDVTLLNALILFDFRSDCCADPGDERAFKNYIKNITDNKNTLASHISDLSDTYYIDKLARDSIYNLREFVLYLDRLGWSSADAAKREFISTYRASIGELDSELSGGRRPQKVSVQIAVQDDAGGVVEDCTMRLVNSDGQTVAQWLSSRIPFLFLADVGTYTMESVQVPAAYAAIRTSIQVTTEDNNRVFTALAIRQAPAGDSGRSGHPQNANGARQGAPGGSGSPNRQPGAAQSGSAQNHRQQGGNKGNRQGGAGIPDLHQGEPQNAAGQTGGGTRKEPTTSQLYNEAFDAMADPSQNEHCLELLERLEAGNDLKSAMLLAFLLEQGVCGRRDADKAGELLMFAGFQEDESTWMETADSYSRKREFRSAVPYYLAASMAGHNGDGYYQAGRIFTREIRNYRMCRQCLELAVIHGVREAQKPFEIMCKISEQQYLQIK